MLVVSVRSLSCLVSNFGFGHCPWWFQHLFGLWKLGSHRVGGPNYQNSRNGHGNHPTEEATPVEVHRGAN